MNSLLFARCFTSSAPRPHHPCPVIFGFFLVIYQHLPTSPNAFLSFQGQCNVTSTHNQSLSASNESDQHQVLRPDESSLEFNEDAARRRVMDRLVPSKVKETIVILQSNGLLDIDCLREDRSKYLREAGICDRDVSDLTSTNEEWSANWRDNFIRNLPTRCQEKWAGVDR